MLLDDALTDDQMANAWRMLWRRLTKARDRGQWCHGAIMARNVGRAVGIDGTWILALVDEAVAESLVERRYVPGQLPAWRRAEYRAEIGSPQRTRRVVVPQGSGSGPHRPGLGGL
jgi:hypothetical protein